MAASHMWAHLREMRDALAALLGPRTQVGAEEVAPAVQPRAGVARLPTGAAPSAPRPRSSHDPTSIHSVSDTPRAAARCLRRVAGVAGLADIGPASGDVADAGDGERVGAEAVVRLVRADLHIHNE